MPKQSTSILLINGTCEIDIVYVHQGKEYGPFAVLQWERNSTKNVKPTIFNQYLKTYEFHIGRYSTSLAAELEIAPDAILSPPSTYPHQAEPYRDAIIKQFPNVEDLTGAFKRSGPTRAGSGASLANVFKELDYQPNENEASYKHIMIVDDTYYKGTTAGAIISRLRDHGVSSDCKITVVCPLWLLPK